STGALENLQNYSQLHQRITTGHQSDLRGQQHCSLEDRERNTHTHTHTHTSSSRNFKTQHTASAFTIISDVLAQQQHILFTYSATFPNMTDVLGMIPSMCVLLLFVTVNKRTVETHCSAFMNAF
ncbi:hypothetical protein CRENBAI_020920, partial [Crenichthys baileyi]